MNSGNPAAPPLDIYHNWVAEKPWSRSPSNCTTSSRSRSTRRQSVISEGQMDRKKPAYGNLALKNWVLLKGFR